MSEKNMYVEVTAIIRIPYDEELTELHRKASEEKRQAALRDTEEIVRGDLRTALGIDSDTSLEVNAEFKGEIK